MQDSMVETLSVQEVRRLALARAGLLPSRWSDLPRTARGSGPTAYAAAHNVIERFGYLQLDTVSIAGARSHSLVLLSRLRGLGDEVGERLLSMDGRLFEYWGHEASWMPLELYPLFEFRRRAFRVHPWWGNVIGENRAVAKRLVKRIRDEGALRSVDMEGPGGRGWWDFKIAKRVATALWSSGELAIRERNNFTRSFDLAERVIPRELRECPIDRDNSIRELLRRALSGHGWATKGTLAATWRLRNLSAPIATALSELESAGEISQCELVVPGEKSKAGWVRNVDLERAAGLRRLRPNAADAVLLSPFDPILWDRARVRMLFGFEQVLEIFKPAGKRVYGYFCLPVLAGERLIGRVDLKADRKNCRLGVVSRHFEDGRPSKMARAAMGSALERLAGALKMTLS